jgi:CBS domain-containing protein
MLARDLMTKEVVTVAPETPVQDIARILLDHGISAVPVIDSTGAPAGIVSEGDLIGRSDSDRLARRDWWLMMVAGASRSADLLSRTRDEKLCARDVMMAPVVSVTETTDAAEIARMLSAYHIKRVPVVHEGRIVGIVSRANLLRALAASPAPAQAGTASTQTAGLLGKALSAIDAHFLHGHEEASAPEPPPSARAEGGLSVADFRALIADHEREAARKEDEKRRAAAQRRQSTVRDLIDHHVADEGWKAILHQAREAAAQGEKELQVLRFPSSLCTDGGRAINAPQPDWPKSLRGEAAEIYLRWERELKPRGFHLTARVLDFPGGKPGDIGLFIVWGE